MAIYFPEPTPQTKATLKRLEWYFDQSEFLPFKLERNEKEMLALNVAKICNAYHEHLVES